LKLHLHHYSKIKIQKESENSRNQGFPYYIFLHDDRRIRIWILEAQKHVDPVDPDPDSDPDPQHWFLLLKNMYLYNFGVED
jgi:hypothetical protein